MTDARAVDLARCGICGDELGGRAPEIACPRCETPYHDECWRFAEGCAVYGCKASLVLAQERIQREVAEALSETAAPSGLTLDISLPGVEWLRPFAAKLSDVPTMVWGAAGLFIAMAGLFRSLAFTKAPVWSQLIDLAFVMFGAAFMGLSPFYSEWLRRFSWGERGPVEIEETPLKQLEARLSLDPENVHLLEIVAMARFAEGDIEGARDLYHEALKVRPEELRLQLQYARTQHLLGEVEVARGWYQRVAEARADTQVRERARWWLEMLARQQARDQSPPVDS